MGRLTQREMFAINKAQRDAFVTYLEFCINQNEVPREELVLAISGCMECEKLYSIVKVIQKKMGNPTPKTVGQKTKNVSLWQKMIKSLEG